MVPSMVEVSWFERRQDGSIKNCWRQFSSAEAARTFLTEAYAKAKAAQSIDGHGRPLGLCYREMFNVES